MIVITDDQSTIQFTDGQTTYNPLKGNVTVQANFNNLLVYHSGKVIINELFTEFTPIFASAELLKDFVENILDQNVFNSDPRISHAYSVILDQFGDVVRVKDKSLLKRGRNDDLGTSEQLVWVQGGFEVYATGNDIDTISSSNAGDTQDVLIEGHTILGNDLTFLVQSATLNGQNEVTLDTPLYRATNIQNDDSTDFGGTVFVYESGGTVTAGVPQVAADIHLETDGTNNQSLKCATSLSSVDYWLITQIEVSVQRQQVRSVDFMLQIREFGKVFTTIFPISANSSGGSAPITFDPIIICPKNSDIRMTAISSGTSTSVSAFINGYLDIIQ